MIKLKKSFSILSLSCLAVFSSTNLLKANEAYRLNPGDSVTAAIEQDQELSATTNQVIDQINLFPPLALNYYLDSLYVY